MFHVYTCMYVRFFGEIIDRVSSETTITRFIELDLRLSDENGKLSDEKLNLPDIMSDELTKDILRPAYSCWFTHKQFVKPNN